jgi:phosphatidyl-myo-inositol dimannoside synthase
MSSDTGTSREQNADSRLRIGLLAPQFPPAIGGMQELALGLATGLAASDHVCVYTLPTNGIPDAPFEQRPLLCKKDLQGNLAVMRAEEHRVDVWCAMDAGLVPLAPFARRPFFSYFHGNDLLNPGYAFPGEWGLKLKGRPVVWRIARAISRLERRRIMRRSLPFVREIFTNSRSTAQLIDRTYPGHGRPVTIIPPGVADAFFQDREDSPSETIRLLTISRLTTQARRKNVEGVIRAVALLKRAWPGIRLAYTIVGDGNDKPRLQQLSAALGLDDVVKFAGFVTREELLAVLRRSDLFVLAPKATAYDVEGFGIVYTEASASGVPVIGSVEGGAIDAIEEGANGLLIQTSTAEAIADGIRRFHDMREGLTQAQVRAVAERFRWGAISDRLRRRIAAHLQSRR